jgi:membrane dipeptidase
MSATSVINRAVIWDNHGCMPLRLDAEFLPQLERYRRAGVTVVSLNIGFAGMDWTRQLQTLSFMRRWVSDRGDHYALIAKPDDVAHCKKTGRLGVVFDIEGMDPVIDNPTLVQTFYELGVRWMLIAYNQSNAAGGGCMSPEDGLTDKGRLIIEEMERVGMVLCLSHASPRTAMEAIEHSRNPVIFSHSNPNGSHQHARNVSDQLISACAKTGGVVGVSGIGPYLGAHRNLTQELLRQLFYVIDLVGPAHVGLGLDYVFDQEELHAYVRSDPALFPTGLEADGNLAMVGPEAIPDIAEGLARQRLNEQDITAILGGNWLRIAQTVWR